MVHKYKSFPVGKSGQRKFKQQFNNLETRSLKNTPNPNGNAVLGTKAAHINFLSILGNNAHEQFAQKGARKTRIDPLSLKKIADNLLKEIESKSANNNSNTGDDDSSDMSDTYSH